MNAINSRQTLIYIFSAVLFFSCSGTNTDILTLKKARNEFPQDEQKYEKQEAPSQAELISDFEKCERSFKEENYGESLKCGKRLYTISPQDYRFSKITGLSYFATGDYSNSRLFLSRARSLNSRDISVTVYLAESYIYNLLYPDAANLLSQALSDDENLSIKVSKIKLDTFINSDTMESYYTQLAELYSLLENNKEDEYLLFNLAFLENRLGNYENAYQHVKKVNLGFYDIEKLKAEIFYNIQNEEELENLSRTAKHDHEEINANLKLLRGFKQGTDNAESSGESQCLKTYILIKTGNAPALIESGQAILAGGEFEECTFRLLADYFIREKITDLAEYFVEGLLGVNNKDYQYRILKAKLLILKNNLTEAKIFLDDITSNVTYKKNIDIREAYLKIFLKTENRKDSTEITENFGTENNREIFLNLYFLAKTDNYNAFKDLANKLIIYEGIERNTLLFKKYLNGDYRQIVDEIKKPVNLFESILLIFSLENIEKKINAMEVLDEGKNDFYYSDLMTLTYLFENIKADRLTQLIDIIDFEFKKSYSSDLFSLFMSKYIADISKDSEKIAKFKTYILIEALI